LCRRASAPADLQSVKSTLVAIDRHRTEPPRISLWVCAGSDMPLSELRTHAIDASFVSNLSQFQILAKGRFRGRKSSIVDPTRSCPRLSRQQGLLATSVLTGPGITRTAALAWQHRSSKSTTGQHRAAHVLRCCTAAEPRQLGPLPLPQLADQKSSTWILRRCRRRWTPWCAQRGSAELGVATPQLAFSRITSGCRRCPPRCCMRRLYGELAACSLFHGITGHCDTMSTMVNPAAA
jgi:hypothetical protein